MDVIESKVNNLINNPSLNKYKGWKGQGSIDDINNGDVRKNDITWTYVRRYINSGATEYAKKAGGNYIFNLNKIKEHLQKNDNLPSNYSDEPKLK